MYAPAPARIKKTDITRSRSGCARCRQKRRKCDEGKPKCRRCATAGSDCQYEAITLKFREATQWAAQKVELGKAIVRTPPVTSDSGAGHERRNSTSDDSPASTSVIDPSLTHEAMSCRFTPGHSSFAQQCDAWTGVPELSAEAEGYPSDPSPASGSPSTVEQGFMAMPTSLGPSKWPEVQLEFDAPLDDIPLDSDDSLFTRLWNFESRAAELPWTDSRTELHIALDTSSESSNQGQSGHANIENNAVAFGPDVGEIHREPMMLDHPPRPQSSSPSTSGRGQVWEHPNDTQAKPLTPAHLPWPKVNKPPSTKISVAHRIYLAHFKISVLQAFPLELPFLWDMVIESDPVRCAALALAAASLANLQGKQLDNDRGTWAAMPIHSAKATAFSAQTVEALESGTSLSLDVRLVTMLLIIYYEHEAGSFSNACHALSILNVTILSNPDDVLSLAEGDNIVRWWLHLRSLTASAQGPHTLCGPETPTETFVKDLELRVATSSQMIDLIGTKAIRLWHRIFVTKCFGVDGDAPASTMKKVDDWWRILKGNHICGPREKYEDAGRLLTENELYVELRNSKMALEGCEAPSGFQPEDLLQLGSSTEKIEPLRFSSHRQAMEVVDYAFAQLMCDERLLRDLLEHSSDLPAQFPAHASNIKNPWVHLILRIAAGLDVSKCGRENAYRRGIICSLFYAGLYCPGQVSSSFLKDTINRMMEARTYFEGPFYPLHGFLIFMQVLEQEIAKGRTIFFSCLTYDEWTTKDRLFSEATDEYLITIGCEADGRYFNDLVPMAST